MAAPGILCQPVRRSRDSRHCSMKSFCCRPMWRATRARLGPRASPRRRPSAATNRAREKPRANCAFSARRTLLVVWGGVCGGSSIGGRQVKTGQDMFAGRRSPGIFRLFAIGELIGDKPLARSSHSIFPTCGGAGESGSTPLARRWSILSRSGRAPGGGSCGGSSYQDIRTRRMNGKNLEPRTAEFGGYRRRELHVSPSPNAKMELVRSLEGDREMEMPGARAPLPIYPSRLGKGWANAAVCQCLLSSIEHRRD